MRPFGEETMETRELSGDILAAAEIIRAGGLVAVPTETVYGLAANAFDEKAVAEIYRVKGRPEVKPLSLMVSGISEIERLCEEVPPAAFVMAEAFWPGPVTLVLCARDTIPEIVRAGGKTVGLRCPDHPLLAELLKTVQLPLAAPSANPSGAESPKNAAAVWNYFDGEIAGIIDGGECTLGRESTIVDLTVSPFQILREGAVSAYEIAMTLLASMTIIGITGGTGSGKTTALEAIRDLGGLVIDTDAVYHRLLAESEPLLAEIHERFPGAIPQGSRDTKALGKHVFSSPEELRALNEITHRFVGEEMLRLLTDWAMRGGKLAAIDAIALIEGGAANLCKATVGILAPREARITRLMRREGISQDYAELRISAQKPDSFFAEHCDYTLMNDGSQEEFNQKSKMIFEEIIRR